MKINKKKSKNQKKSKKKSIYFSQIVGHCLFLIRWLRFVNGKAAAARHQATGQDRTDLLWFVHITKS